MIYKDRIYFIGNYGIYTARGSKKEYLHKWRIHDYYYHNECPYIWGITKKGMLYVYDLELQKRTEMYVGDYSWSHINFYIENYIEFITNNTLYIVKNQIIYFYRLPYKDEYILDITDVIGSFNTGFFIGFTQRFGKDYIFTTNSLKLDGSGNSLIVIPIQNTYIGIFDRRKYTYTLYYMNGEPIIKVPCIFIDNYRWYIKLPNGKCLSFLLEEIAK